MATAMLPKVLAELIARFADNEDSYTNVLYNEASTRLEFIDKLFILLGWDVYNDKGYAEQYKDVLTEGSLKVGTGTKAPDYCFRVGGTRKFLVEAKKPAVDIAKDADPAFQLRRYGWSAQLPLGVVTNFRQMSVYDCRSEPDKTDGASVARVLTMTFREFPDRWGEVEAILSRDAVLKGAFDKYTASMKGKRGNVPVDRSFLAELDRWRALLARNFANRNSSLDEIGVNYAVQQTIDRIVFLRISEDRGIEPYGQLQSIIKVSDSYDALCRLFREADDKYNSGLFHFRNEPHRPSHPDTLTLSLTLDSRVLKEIVKRLYYPDSPYEFSVLPTEILGLVYERFLGKVIRLSSIRRVVVEEKPEIKKAGGVYYTPTLIVSEIVRQTLGPRLANEKHRQVSGVSKGATKMRILDPACGSGTFLLDAYQYLLDWYLAEYTRGPTAPLLRGRKPRLFQGSDGSLRLTTSERKRILLDHIFGVDIDTQAVGVTKLSLLLKVLEGESATSIGKNLQLFNERALPDLDGNIRCGNSLVEPDFLIHRSALGLPRDEVARVNPFDWQKEFPEAAADGGFDVILGNPPWLMAGYYIASAMEYLKDRYISATGKFDLYYLFLERVLGLVRMGSRIGMIVPNKLFHTRAARQLRELLTADGWLERIIDFGEAQVFESATNYSAIVLLQKNAPGDPKYSRVDANIHELRSFDVPRASLGAAPWIFEDSTKQAIRKKLNATGQPLESLVEHFGHGVQSGADRLLVLGATEATKLKIEQALLTPILRGREVRRFVTARNTPSLLFPYSVKSGAYAPLTQSELARHPNANRYLLRHQKKLEQRRWFGASPEEKSGHWYGMMHLDHWKYIKKPHIVTPALSDRSNFARNEARLFVTGTAGVTSIVLRDDVREDMRYLLGLLNSSVLNWYIVGASPVYRGGYYKFSAPYLRSCPIRMIDFAVPAETKMHDAVVQLVDELEAVYQSLGDDTTSGHARTLLERRSDNLEVQLDEVVCELYDLTARERAQITLEVNSDS